MKVKLLTAYGTLRRAYQAGAVIEVPDAEGVRLVERFLVLPYRAEEDPEMAVKRTQGERAARRVRPSR